VLLFGKSFSGSAAPLQAILPAKISSGLYMLLASFLVVKGYFRPLLVIQGFSLACNLGLNAVLIPFLGANGAAWGATCSSTLGLFTLIYYLGSAHDLRARAVLLPRVNETVAVLKGIFSSKIVKS
jgi:O-antigen/teichoic acid export membrane protein